MRRFTPAQMKKRRRVFYSALAAAASGQGRGGNGGNGGVLPSDLPDYWTGSDFSSWVDPGGAAHRQATLATAVTNLASGGPVMTPHFAANYPVLHDGAWTGLATWEDIPDPNGETWFSTNPGTEDVSFPNITEWEQDLSLLTLSPAISIIIVAYHPSNQGGQLYRPYYGGDGVNRLEISNTSTGQILLRTPNYGPTTFSTIGDLRGAWYIYGVAWGQGSLLHWLNGEQQTTTSMTGATGNMGFDTVGYGTAPDGGVGCHHSWLRQNTPEEMDSQMEALAARFGIPYTFIPLP